MTRIPLTPDERRRLVRLIAERAGILTPLERQNLLEDSGLARFKVHLDFAVNSWNFANQLVRVLQEAGTLRATGEPALLSLLRELREIMAGQEEDAAFVNELLARPAAEQGESDEDDAAPPASGATPAAHGHIRLAPVDGSRLTLMRGAEAVGEGGTVRVGEVVTVRFTVRNDDLMPIGIRTLVIGARGPGAAREGWSAPILPFAGDANIVLAPGQSHLYEQSRAIPEPGDYFIEPNLQDLHGGWHGIAPFTRISFNVVE